MLLSLSSETVAKEVVRLIALEVDDLRETGVPILPRLDDLIQRRQAVERLAT